MIRALATSLSGSEHVVVGGVRDGQSYEWQSQDEARVHLNRIQWTNVRLQIDEETTEEGGTIITWDNQDKTQHSQDWKTWTYLRGGPVQGAKISKSDLTNS
jgi:hypothetical protein